MLPRFSAWRRARPNAGSENGQSVQSPMHIRGELDDFSRLTLDVSAAAAIRSDNFEGDFFMGLFLSKGLAAFLPMR